jgi:perosamine synthetase
MTPDEQSPPGRERLITVKTQAVIPVGLYGLPADMPAIRAIAEKFELHLIEDAAQPLGGKYSGKM